MAVIPVSGRTSLPQTRAMFVVADYKSNSNTWRAAIAAAHAAAQAALGGYVIYPAGQRLNVDEAGHSQIFWQTRDGNGAVEPALGVGKIIHDLNGATLQFGANTRRWCDALKVADYDWFSNMLFQNGELDFSLVPYTASNEHAIYGCAPGGALSNMNFRGIQCRNLWGYGLTSRGLPAGHGMKQWVCLSPTVPKNQAAVVTVRDCGMFDCRLDGGDSPFLVGASLLGADVTDLADYFNAICQDFVAERVTWNAGNIPTRFASGGAQVGGFALVRGGHIKECRLYGSGDCGLEVDNSHGFVVETTTVENSWNANFLLSVIGGNDTDQPRQRFEWRDCSSLVTDASLVSCVGFFCYATRHRQLGEVRNINPYHHSVAIHTLGEGEAFSYTSVTNMTLAQLANAGATTFYLSLVTDIGYSALAATRNLFLGGKIHLDAGANGEWLTVNGIGSDGTGTFFTASTPSLHGHAAGVIVVHPSKSAKLVLDGPRARMVGWNYAGVPAFNYYPFDFVHQGCAIDIHDGQLEVSGSTANGAGALSVAPFEFKGTDITYDINNIDVSVTLVVAGAPCIFRGIESAGLPGTYRPSTQSGRVNNVRYKTVAGFAGANATGIYVPDRTALLLGRLDVLPCDFTGLPAGAKEITWQTAGENLHEVRLYEGSRPRQWSTWPRTQRIKETFSSGGLANTQVGETGGATGDRTAAGQLIRALAVVSHAGIIQLDTGVQAGGNTRYWSVVPPGNPDIDLTEWFDFFFVFQLVQVNANTVMRVGFAENPSLSPPLYGYWLRLLAGSANMEFTVSNGGGTHVGTLATIAPDTAWHLLRIRRYSDNGGTVTIEFTLDAAAPVTFTAANDIALPTARSGNPFAHIDNNGTVNSEKLLLDDVDLIFPNVVSV